MSWLEIREQDANFDFGGRFGETATAAGVGKYPERYSAIGFQMIQSIVLENFKCFRQLEVSDCRRVNVIVGDNGSGKTALLEAIFMALNGSAEFGFRFRTQRGIDAAFVNNATLDNDVFADYFFDFDMNRPISVKLNGDGPERRLVEISRQREQPVLQFDEKAQMTIANNQRLDFAWTDMHGKRRSANPEALPTGGVQLNTTGEQFPQFHYISAFQNVGSTEVAARFSMLSKNNKAKQFIEIFTREFPEIEDLSIETAAGNAAVLHASVKGLTSKIPVANISGAINRLIGIFISIAAHPKSVILVDEIENGVFHEHYKAMWKAILQLCREYDAQLFTTTHSIEWIRALIEAAGRKVDDISLMRVSKTRDNRILNQYSGGELKNGLEYGVEVR